MRGCQIDWRAIARWVSGHAANRCGQRNRSSLRGELPKQLVDLARLRVWDDQDISVIKSEPQRHARHRGSIANRPFTDRLRAEAIGAGKLQSSRLAIVAVVFRRVWPELDPLRERRARDWEFTGVLTVVAAIAVLIWTTAGSSGWRLGDLLVAVYFGLLAVSLWAQGQRVRLSRSGAPFTRAVAVAFGVALLIGMSLMVAAITSSGRL